MRDISAFAAGDDLSVVGPSITGSVIATSVAWAGCAFAAGQRAGADSVAVKAIIRDFIFQLRAEHPRRANWHPPVYLTDRFMACRFGSSALPFSVVRG